MKKLNLIVCRSSVCVWTMAGNGALMTDVQYYNGDWCVIGAR